MTGSYNPKAAVTTLKLVEIIIKSHSPSTLPIGVCRVRSGLLPHGLKAPSGLDSPAVTKVSSSSSESTNKKGIKLTLW